MVKTTATKAKAKLLTIREKHQGLLKKIFKNDEDDKETILAASSSSHNLAKLNIKPSDYQEYQKLEKDAKVMMQRMQATLEYNLDVTEKQHNLVKT